MWSTVAMFVLTFAILGLLLGIAEIYDVSSSEGLNSSPEAAPAAGNSTSAEPSGDDAISIGG